MKGGSKEGKERYVHYWILIMWVVKEKGWDLWVPFGLKMSFFSGSNIKNNPKTTEEHSGPYVRISHEG